MSYSNLRSQPSSHLDSHSRNLLSNSGVKCRLHFPVLPSTMKFKSASCFTSLFAV